LREISQLFVGLGTTQPIDAVATGLVNSANSLSQIKFLGFVFDIVLIGLFFLFGRLARQGRRWPFLLGMILYGLDSLIFLWVQDYLGLGFHAFALFGLYRGLQALEQLKTLSQTNLQTTEAVQSTLS
jgi:MFS family permease